MNMNRESVAKNVDALIAVLEGYKVRGMKPRVRISVVYGNLSIFDWWNDYLSLTQLKQMRDFLKTAGEMGYNGYVCFKVGAKGCSHGMWAFKEESTTGYSPDGECLHHSFRSGDNYWNVLLPSGLWLSDRYRNSEGRSEKWEFTLKEVKAALAEERRAQ